MFILQLKQTLDDTYNVNELHVTTNASPARQAPPNNYRGLSSSGETSTSSHDPYKTRNYQGQSISSNYPTEAYEGLAARTTQRFVSFLKIKVILKFHLKK